MNSRDSNNCNDTNMGYNIRNNHRDDNRDNNNRNNNRDNSNHNRKDHSNRTDNNSNHNRRNFSSMDRSSFHGTSLSCWHKKNNLTRFHNSCCSHKWYDHFHRCTPRHIPKHHNIHPTPKYRQHTYYYSILKSEGWILLPCWIQRPLSSPPVSGRDDNKDRRTLPRS